MKTTGPTILVRSFTRKNLDGQSTAVISVVDNGSLVCKNINVTYDSHEDVISSDHLPEKYFPDTLQELTRIFALEAFDYF